MNFLAFVQGVCGIQHDPVVRVEALQDFEGYSIVSADGERLQVRLMICIHDHGTKSFGAEQQRVHRHLQPRAGHFHLQVHLRVAAGQQRAVMIWHVHFGQQSPRCGIDGLRCAHHFAFKSLAGVLRKLEKRAEPRMNRGRVCLRHTHVNADGIGLRQEKELLRRAAISRVDQRADINVAPRDEPAERRINVPEGFQFLQPPYVGLGGLHNGFLGLQIAIGVVYLLLAHAVRLDQFRKSRGGNFGEVRVCFGGVEIRARL